MKKILSLILAVILSALTLPWSYLPRNTSGDAVMTVYEDSGEPVRSRVCDCELQTAAAWFNAFVLDYSADAYVRGTATFDNGFGKEKQEVFFLEPGENVRFRSFIDGVLDGRKMRRIVRLRFEALDKPDMRFSLLRYGTVNCAVPDREVYLSNEHFKLGIDLLWGGAMTYLEDLDSDVQAVKKDGHVYVDSSAAARYGAKSVNDHVNLINAHDTGRLVQQSYYGVREDPGYVNGVFNENTWPYNPVQGGNMFDDSSKIVDLQVTDSAIYIKCRPMDWAKDAASVTPSYMEAWYTLDGAFVRTDCRFVDFSGFENVPRSSQELPAFYCVEPLNRFVWYDGDDPWNDPDGLAVEPELEFWAGKSAAYYSKENWVAFTGAFEDSFGIGLYAPGQTHFKTGIFKIHETKLSDPSLDDPTCYTAVIDTWTLNSFKPFTYTYYLATGTVQQIRAQFGTLASEVE